MKKIKEFLKALIEAIANDWQDMQQYGLVGKNFKGGGTQDTNIKSK